MDPSPETPLTSAAPPLRARAMEWVRGVIAATFGLVIPGLGHLMIGRARRGLLWFLAMLILVNWQMMAALTDTSAPLRAPIPGVQTVADWLLSAFLPNQYLGVIGTLAPLWLLSFLDGILCTVVPLLPAWRRFREARLRSAAAHLVRREHTEALRELARIRAVDRSDPAACLWTSLTLRLAGRPREALPYARRPVASRSDSAFRRTFAPALHHEIDIVKSELAALARS